jgi:hypothetical protein
MSRSSLTSSNSFCRRFSSASSGFIFPVPTKALSPSARILPPAMNQIRMHIKFPGYFTNRNTFFHHQLKGILLNSLLN